MSSVAAMQGFAGKLLASSKAHSLVHVLILILIVDSTKQMTPFDTEHQHVVLILLILVFATAI